MFMGLEVRLHGSDPVVVNLLLGVETAHLTCRQLQLNLESLSEVHI